MLSTGRGGRTLGVEARVQFRHPLVRSTIYQAASPEARRRVHGALAAATDGETDADRRAWHRANAADGPDDEVADELEQSASRARARGGVAAAAAFLEWAATLSLDPLRRRDRALNAAEMKVQAGSFKEAVRVGWPSSTRARTTTCYRLDPSCSAGHRLRDETRQRGGRVAARCGAAVRGAGRPRRSRDVSRGAHGWHVPGRLAVGAGIVEVASSAAELPRPSSPVLRTYCSKAGALVHRRPCGGPTSAATAIKAVRDPGLPHEEQERGYPLSCTASMELWDDEGWYQDTARHVDVVRDSGALSELPFCLISEA